MLYYKFNVITKKMNEEEVEKDFFSSRPTLNFTRIASEQADLLYDQFAGECFVLYTRDTDEGIELVGIARAEVDWDTVIFDYLERLNISFESYHQTEISLESFVLLLKKGKIDSYVHRHAMMNNFSIKELNDANLRTAFFKEKMVDTSQSMTEISRNLIQKSFSPTLVEEVARIQKGTAPEQINHPVHYILDFSVEKMDNVVLQNLLKSLLQAHRLVSKRYSIIEIKSPRVSFENISDLYHASAGGTVVIDWALSANKSRQMLPQLFSIVREFHRDVLTIINIRQDEKSLINQIKEGLGELLFVELRQDKVSKQAAFDYFEYRANDVNLSVDDALRRALDSSQELFESYQLSELFDKWESKKRRGIEFPQYALMDTVEEIKISPTIQGEAYQELLGMVGLANVKVVVEQAVNFYKLQAIYKKQGIKSLKPAMHLDFQGAPGTAKTTVARLFAKILKENGVLPIGNLVEVGRSDLVGMYVGQTAPLVSEKFRQARGSVLFIDEAYGLVDSENGSYGKEAITQIVAEMENHREDTVVIFAGYPKEMKTFLNSNPGLTSRIAFHILFDDYSSDELVGIAQLIARQHELILGEGVPEKIATQVENIRKMDPANFGNGREVRKLIEHAAMHMSTRLMNENFTEKSREDLMTLVVDDFVEELAGKPEQQVDKIGFL